MDGAEGLVLREGALERLKEKFIWAAEFETLNFYVLRVWLRANNVLSCFFPSLSTPYIHSYRIGSPIVTVFSQP